jgi:hypothetical protein
MEILLLGKAGSKGSSLGGQAEKNKWKGKQIKICRQIWKRGN